MQSCVQTCSWYHLIYVKRFTGHYFLLDAHEDHLSFPFGCFRFIRFPSCPQCFERKKCQDPECITRSSLPWSASPGTTPSPTQTCLLVLVPGTQALAPSPCWTYAVGVPTFDHVPRCSQIVLIFWIDLGFDSLSVSDGCWTPDAGVGPCCSYHPCSVYPVWDWGTVPCWSCCCTVWGVVTFRAQQCCFFGDDLLFLCSF